MGRIARVSTKQPTPGRCTVQLEASSSAWVENPHLPPQPGQGLPVERLDVGNIGDHDGQLIFVVEAVQQQVGCQVDVGTLLLGVHHLDDPRAAPREMSQRSALCHWEHKFLSPWLSGCQECRVPSGPALNSITAGSLSPTAFLARICTSYFVLGFRSTKLQPRRGVSNPIPQSGEPASLMRTMYIRGGVHSAATLSVGPISLKPLSTMENVPFDPSQEIGGLLWLALDHLLWVMSSPPFTLKDTT